MFHASPYESRLGTVGIALATGMAYFMAAELGLALRAETGTSVFWPAAGISVGVLIVWGPRARLPVAAGVIVATIVSNLTIGRNPWLACAFGVVNAGQVLLTTGLIERWFGRSFKLGDVPQVLGFLMASAIGASVGAMGAAIAVGLIQPTALPYIVWRFWFASCLLGIVTVAPLLVGIGEVVRQLPPRRELVDSVVGILMLAALCAFVISLPQGPWSTAVPVMLVFPVLLWVIVRCRPVFAATASFVVALAIVWSITFSVGHFGDASVPLLDRILAAQTVVLAGALLTLVLAALFAERRRDQASMQKSERKLRELLGALPAAIYVTDAAGHITYCNQRAIDLWGDDPILGKDRWSDFSKFYYADGSPMPLADCPTEIALKQGRVAPGREGIIERKDGKRIPIAPYPTPLHDDTGAIVGVVNMTVDISERKKAELALAERNLQLALAGKAALVGSFAYDMDTEEIQISQGYAAMHGFPEGTTHIARDLWQVGVHPEDRGRVDELRSRAFRDQRGEYGCEYRIVRSGAEERWIEARCFVSYRSDGSPQRVVGVNIDVTERKQAEDHQRMLVAELDHRVKNVLATVSAVAARTLDSNSSMDQFVTALDGRIRSMATTHELLSGRQWKGIPLADLLRHQLAPYATSNNMDVKGPEVLLSAAAGQTIGMVLHELITNAAKYGALSTHDGRISVRWYWPLNGKVPDRLVIEWQETGGPAVQVPDRPGHGMEVIRDLLPYELDANVDLAFASGGVRCRFDIPVSQLTNDDQLGDKFIEIQRKPFRDSPSRQMCGAD